jgi:hypothetical protein
MTRNYLLISAACLVFLFGCASRQKTDTPAASTSSSQSTTSTKAAPAPAARADVRKVKSKDGVEGEIFGTPAAKSKFARVEIGMSRTRVERLIGGPDDSETHITGRQFQPFYFGGDTQRYEAFYKDEGQLTYSNNSRGSAPETLIIILVDTKADGNRH